MMMTGMPLGAAMVSPTWVDWDYHGLGWLGRDRLASNLVRSAVLNKQIPLCITSRRRSAVWRRFFCARDFRHRPCVDPHAGECSLPSALTQKLAPLRRGFLEPHLRVGIRIQHADALDPGVAPLHPRLMALDRVGCLIRGARRNGRWLDRGTRREL